MVVQVKSSLPPENPETDDNPENSSSVSEKSLNLCEHIPELLISHKKSEAAAHVLNLLKKRQRSSLKNGFDSLEVLRMSIQSYFNKQVEALMTDFMEKFFQPAIENIKENTDERIDDKQV